MVLIFLAVNNVMTSSGVAVVAKSISLIFKPKIEFRTAPPTTRVSAPDSSRIEKIF